MVNLCIKATYIPREDYEHGSDRHLTNETLESIFCLTVGVLESLVANLKQVFGTLHSCCNFLAGVGDGAAHLDSQFLSKLSFVAGKLLEELLYDFLSLLERGFAKSLKRLRGDLGQ